MFPGQHCWPLLGTVAVEVTCCCVVDGGGMMAGYIAAHCLEVARKGAPIDIVAGLLLNDLVQANQAAA